MPKIINRFKNKELNRYFIKKGASLSIGRLPDNDIIIDNDAVSGKHAKIISKDDEYYIEDLKSTNGTFLNNKRVYSRKLTYEDTITIGKHELVFEMAEDSENKPADSPKLSTGMASRDKTSALDTMDYQKIKAKNIYGSNRATLLILKFKGKQLRKYILKHDKHLMIGRLSDNDIVIENEAVSGKHAKIISKDDEYYIDDLNSTNGTFVNKKKITSHMLKDEDIITIGKHELIFCLNEKCTLEETLLPYDYNTMYSTDATMALDVSKNRAYLSFLKGGQGDVIIGDGGIKIGRDSDSDIFLRGFMTGRSTVMILNSGDGYFLSCEKSKKKTKVNGTTIKGTIKLSNSDVIEIGSIKLIFHNP